MVSVTRTVFGELPSGGGTVEKFQLRSDRLTVDIISWGCTITALHVPDRQGRASDVVLGFAELEGGSLPPAQGCRTVPGPYTLPILRSFWPLAGFDSLIWKRENGLMVAANSCVVGTNRIECKWL